MRHLTALQWKKLTAWLLVGLTGLLVIGAALWLIIHTFYTQTTVRLGDGIFTAQIAQTNKERIKGLSGSAQLSESQAMLFVFDGDGEHPIWMKDMHYAIDIVWLDAGKKVVHMAHDIPPQSYPEKFKSNVPARYVIEFRAGTLDAKRITIGKQATFTLPAERGK